MKKQIEKYLKDNMPLFALEDLIEALKKAGYPIDLINQVAQGMLGGSKLEQQEDKGLFWDFKAYRTKYTKPEEIIDFIFGFILPWVAGFVLLQLSIIGVIFQIVFYVFSLAHFRSRRKYIYRGLLANLFFIVVFLLISVAFVFRYMIN